MRYIMNYIKQETPSHQHKDYEVIVYTSGNGVFLAGGKQIPVFPGKIVIIPPGVMHGVEFSDNLERIYIRGEFSHIFNLTSPTVVLDNAENEGRLLAKMIYNNRYANAEYVTALVGAFAHYLTQSLKMEDKISATIEEIVDQITNNFYDSNINLNALLQNSGYAEDYIRAQFKRFTGRTPIEFLTRVRINHACYLIDTYKYALSLAEIAEKCGYTDYVYFSRRFKNMVGVSPRKYMEDSFV